MHTVPLSKTYTIGTTVFSQLVFRDPKLADYRALGRPREWQFTVEIRDKDVIFAYADRLLQQVPPGALGELDIVDALAIEDLILGFFPKPGEAPPKPGSSSSVSDGAPATLTT